MRVLLVDNYDSFTGNLEQYIAELTGERPWVVKNDQHSVDELLAYRPERIVLSPGPGRPEVATDRGVSGELVERAEVPLLGVCLGHQILGWCLGARVTHAPAPRHGRRSPIEHDGSGLFAGLPRRFQVVRYHSLILDRASLPPSLVANAFTDDGLVMAVRHRQRPLHGLQFHPESILSQHGRALLRTFLAPPAVLVAAPSPPRAPLPDGAYTIRAVPFVEPEAAFAALFAAESHAFWLDSPDGRGRFSYLGAGDERLIADRSGVRLVDGEREARRGDDLFTVLAEEGRIRGAALPAGLPGELASGWVGCLGYGLKRLTGGDPEPGPGDGLEAVLLRVDRLLVCDHAARACFLVARGDPRWVEETAVRLAAARPPPPVDELPLTGAPLDLAFHRGRDGYRRDLAHIHQLLTDGETYEICLTTQLAATVRVDPLRLHRLLRRRNPAPYAALIRFGPTALVAASPECFVRLDGDGRIESRPIKGTRPRDPDPTIDEAIAGELAAAEKDRAENLMIVDLVRSDLGTICRPGSVQVPSLMVVERHPTVHQLVSTVAGELAPGISPAAAVRALFPGGSMTGAPKIRALAILDRLEGAPRGLYAGAFGLFADHGAAHLAMTIRSFVVGPDEVRFGVGGAVVALSEPEAELAELFVKARALVETLAVATGRPVSITDG